MEKYDVGIIGAGLAGMALAIQLAEGGVKVLIVDKQSYPRHKVCGEFLSKESIPFLKRLGLPIDSWGLPEIDHLLLSSEKGAELRTALEVGGIGISRYKLDHELSKLLNHPLIRYMDNTKVESINHEAILIQGQQYSCDLIVGAFGKYPPHFVKAKNKVGKNYIGVKYHIKLDHRKDEIALHSFKGGYCGMSKIENDLSCLCYLVDAEMLKGSGSIRAMERDVLYKNTALANIFDNAQFIFSKPMIISNIQFQDKLLYDNDIVYVGDAAGAISPLSGNGMSMALRASLILADTILGQSKEPGLEYAKKWYATFKPRINRAKYLNQIMLHPFTHHLVLKSLNRIPAWKRKIVREMQGKEF